MARSGISVGLFVLASVASAAAGAPWLVDVTEPSGLRAAHHSGAAGDWRLPEIMGGGVALFDADADGDLDVYLVDHAGPNRLFVQEAPWRFVDATERSGLGDGGRGMGVAIGDADGDGDVDVYVTNHGPDRLYVNRGDGRFVDGTSAAGIDVGGWSTSATFLDADADGRLDLWVARYVRDSPVKRCEDAAGRVDYCSPAVYAPVGDVLLRNVGGGRFQDVSEAAGLRTTAARGLGVVAADLDDDGFVDVYVANDGDANHYWVNRGDGTFAERALIAGVAYNMDGEAEAGMGVVAEDFDGDGLLDLFMTHLADESNTYYRNRGGGRGFEDATGASGLAAGSLPWTGFGVAALDLELDGDLDLLVANGRVTRGRRAVAGLAEPWSRFAEPDTVWIRDDAGRYREAADVAPALAATPRISRGLAVGDIDGDGDEDVVIGAVEGPVRLLRNDAPREGRALALRVLERDGRAALGATVDVVAGSVRRRRSVTRAGSYLSSRDAVVHAGVGAAAPDGIVVRWVGGARERFAAPAADRVVTLRRGDGEAVP